MGFLSANGEELNSDNYSSYNPDTKTLITSINKNYQARKYILGPNDVLSISIYGVQEFKHENVRVQPDGKITIVPLGSFDVSGSTVDELQNKLVEACKQYIKNPLVSVQLVQLKPFVVYVSGEVINPGSYELNTSTNASPYYSKPEAYIERKTPLLTNVLVAAGGVKYNADIRHVQITNIYDKTKFEVNLLDLLENGDANQDVYLVPGDTIHVPKLVSPLALTEEEYKKYATATFSPRVIPVKVIGCVNSPGLVRLNPSESFDLNAAITAAGGYFNDSAYAPKKVFLSRVDNNGKLVTRVVNPMEKNVVLMPDDVIFVPEKVRPFIGKGFDYLARMMNPINGFANGYNNWSVMFEPKRFR